MVLPPRRVPSAKGREHGRALVIARSCVVVPWICTLVVAITEAFWPGAERVLGPVPAVVVAVCVAGLLAVLARHPAPSRQDSELTFTLVVGPLLMVLPALATGLYPMAVLPLLPPVVVGVAALRERRSSSREDSSRA